MTREVINELKKFTVGKRNTEKTEISVFTLNRIIFALEEQAPKVGHWIQTNDYLTCAYGSVDYVRCSCCGENSLEEGNYCPNCGVKMEG